MIFEKLANQDVLAKAKQQWIELTFDASFIKENYLIEDDEVSSDKTS